MLLLIKFLVLIVLINEINGFEIFVYFEIIGYKEKFCYSVCIVREF